MFKMRRHIKNLVKETCKRTIPSVGLTLADPPEDNIEELEPVIQQYYNRYNSEELQDDLDKAMEKLFDQVILSAGHESQLNRIKRLKFVPLPVIMYFKNQFQRLRPYQLSDILGVPWSGDGKELRTDDSFSYPSGHTCQAYFIALKLKDSFPALESELLSVAEAVAQSRVDRGVHFHSDLDAGRDLADQLYKLLKPAPEGKI